MVIYAGRGEVTGDLCGPLSAGDIVVVPAGCAHGFIGGASGLYALSIQFGEGLYTDPDNARVIFVDSGHSLEGLLAYNAGRLDEFTRHSLFDRLAERRAATGTWREAFLTNLESLFDVTHVLLARHATSREQRFEPELRRHLQERLLALWPRSGKTEDPAQAQGRKRDPLIRAFSDWFTYQMYVLDNVEKTAIVHLVLEPAALACRTRLAAILGTDSPWPLRDGGAEDEAALSIGPKLLQHETLQTYQRLEEVTGEAWDVLRALADRIAELGRATK
jgi:hypothetical protein